ncbi:hypothetical protein GGF43_000540 [Coemansia sp. RSA 2618]|nr:hypothetical protein GGF43_000540 [Coemansia sp. RSA 2618]
MLTAVLASTVLGALAVNAQSSSDSPIESLISILLENAHSTEIVLPPTASSSIPVDAQQQAQLDQIKEIYCPDQSCSSDRDWLTKPPNAASNWVLGAISLVVCLMTFRAWYAKSANSFSAKFCLPPSGAGMGALFISLFLRASLSLSTGNKESIYIASLFFNYMAGLIMCSALHVNALALKTLFQPPTAREKGVAIAIRNVLFWCPISLFIVGLVYSFGVNGTSNEASGAHCIEAALVLIMCTVLGVAAMMCWRAKAIVSSLSKSSIYAALAFIVLLLLWASFMFSRLFLSIETGARGSQILFGLLNHAVLIVCGIVALVLGQPLESPNVLLVTHRNVRQTCNKPADKSVESAEKSTATEELYQQGTNESMTTAPENMV